MRRFIKSKKNKVLKSIDDNNLGSIVRTLLSSFVIIFAFYSLPLITNFTNDKILNKNRIGDHIWWISDNSEFKKDYPRWKIKIKLKKSLEKIISHEFQNRK